MKILFSGYHNPSFSTITEYIEKAIVSVENEIFIFDDRKHLFPGRIRRQIKWLGKLDISIINKRFITVARKVQPHIAIITGGHRIQPDTIDTLKSMNIATCLWTIDAPVDFQPILDAAPHYDFVFCQGTEAIDILSKSGLQNLKWLPMACDPEIHKQVQLTDKEKEKLVNEIVFVGSYYKNRADLLRNIINFDLGIWGPGWERLEKDDPLRKCIKGGSVVPEDFNKICSAAKIVVVCHYQDGKIPCYQASPKVFEAMACDAFVLVDDQKDVFSLFEDGKHLVKYKNAENLTRKIEYFLSHPIERKKISLQGYEETIKHHTYVNRVRSLFSYISGKT